MVLDYIFYKTNPLPAIDSIWNLSRSVRLARAEFYVIDMHTQEFSTMTNNLHTSNLQSLMILDMMAATLEEEASDEITDEGAMDISNRECGYRHLKSVNIKMALAIRYGAKTTKCPEYKEIDVVIKNQLYSRDMAGYTTSLLTERVLQPAPPWSPDMKIPAVKEKYEAEMKAYHDSRKLHRLADYTKEHQIGRNTFLENLFHLRETSS